MTARVAIGVAAALLVSGFAAGCKDKGPKKEPLAGSATHAVIDAGAPPPGDWATCKTGLAAAAKAPETQRVATIIDACKPCGDWRPILTWSTLTEDGGPTRREIELAMVGCKAFCDPTAKTRFMGSLEDSRAKKTRSSWRDLGQVCKEKVSAVPDARYLAGHYFALDRIARWAGEQPDGGPLLAALDIPLPPITSSGVGVKLPEAAVTTPEPITAHLTVTPTDFLVGTAPRAKLSASGVTVANDTYPGTSVTAAKLPDAIGKLGGKAAVFAPAIMVASRVAEAVVAAGPHTTMLAVASVTSTVGWMTNGIVPVAMRGGKSDKDALEIALGEDPAAAVDVVKKSGEALNKATPAIKIDPAATVEGLAQVLGALAFVGVTSATLVGPPPGANKPAAPTPRKSGAPAPKKDPP